jgi:hypothetical protein
VRASKGRSREREEARNENEIARPTVRAAAVKGNPHDGRVVVAHGAHVFHVGGLHKGVDTGKVGEFAPRKGRNGLVVDAARSGQTNFEPPGDFGVVLGGGNVGFL